MCCNKKSKDRKKYKIKKLCRDCGKNTKGHTLCPSCELREKKRKRESLIKFNAKVGNYYENECQICGLKSFDYEVYDVHHFKQTEKKYLISSMKYKNWETEVIPELEKCVYLCSNCHRKLHYGRFDEAIKSGKLFLVPGKVE